jgi:AraC family transcriptional regulator
MDVKLVELPAVKVLALRYSGAYGPAIGAFWRDTFLPLLAANGLERLACYGIGRDDPSFTPAEKCRYDACVEVPDTLVAGSEFDLMTLPGGRYAVMRFEGTGATMGDAWGRFYRDWLPASGLGRGVNFDGRPCFEYYPMDGGFGPVSGVFECDLCIPVGAG